MWPRTGNILASVAAPFPRKTVDGDRSNNDEHDIEKCLGGGGGDGSSGSGSRSSSSSSGSSSSGGNSNDDNESTAADGNND